VIPPSRVFVLPENRWLIAALIPAVVLRALTVLGYPPALWFWADSFSYLRTAADLTPSAFRPAGYSFFLALFRPAHSFALVTSVQHALGPTLAVAAYALLRRRGLPGWGATLAVTPMLYDEFLLLLEHLIMADALFTALLTGGVLVLLRARLTPCAAALGGLLLASAALTRTIGLPVLALAAGYVLVRRTGRRALVALLAAGALPLAGYAAWAGAVTGVFGLTRADGLFLWARTMTFADCAVIRPHPRLTPLCPDRPLAGRPSPAHWLWRPDAPYKRLPSGAGRDASAAEFARAAILAQPGAYLAAAGRDLGLTLRWERTTAGTPGSDRVNPYHFPFAARPAKDPVAAAYERGPATTRPVEPYAGWLRAYQRFGYLPFPALVALLAVSGLRRSPDVLFPALTAALLIAAPPFLTGYDVRYVVPAIPLVCLASGLAAAGHLRGGTRLNAGNSHAGGTLWRASSSTSC
jgi:hypothetical protein